MTSIGKISILLADDHPIARAGIRKILEQAEDFELLGEAENGFEAMELVRTLNPQVLLLDLKMPGPRPAEIEKWVRENHPEIVTLILTSHDRDIYLAQMMDAGVSGYMNKDISTERLIGAIRRAVQGEILFDQVQMRRAQNWRDAVGEKLKHLTARENEILKLLAEGRENKAIASAMGVTPKTAAYHVANTLKKLSLKNRQEAAIWVLKNLPDDLE